MKELLVRHPVDILDGTVEDLRCHLDRWEKEHKGRKLYISFSQSTNYFEIKADPTKEDRLKEVDSDLRSTLSRLALLEKKKEEILMS